MYFYKHEINEAFYSPNRSKSSNMIRVVILCIMLCCAVLCWYSSKLQKYKSRKIKQHHEQWCKREKLPKTKVSKCVLSRLLHISEKFICMCMCNIWGTYILSLSTSVCTATRFALPHKTTQHSLIPIVI